MDRPTPIEQNEFRPLKGAIELIFEDLAAAATFRAIAKFDPPCVDGVQWSVGRGHDDYPRSVVIMPPFTKKADARTITFASDAS
jgi:hypothetical protein